MDVRVMGGNINYLIDLLYSGTRLDFSNAFCIVAFAVLSSHKQHVAFAVWP